MALVPRSGGRTATEELIDLASDYLTSPEGRAAIRQGASNIASAAGAGYRKVKRKIENLLTEPRRTPTMKASRGGVGQLVGRFKRPNKRPTAGKATKHGYTMEKDVYGSISNNEVAYIGVRSMVPSLLNKAVGCALIRHIMKKHYGYQYYSEDSLLLNGDPADTVFSIPVLKPPLIIRFFFIRENNTTSTTGTGTGDIVFGNQFELYNFTAGRPTTPVGATVAGFGDWFHQNICANQDYSGGSAYTGTLTARGQRFYGYQLIENHQQQGTVTTYTGSAIIPCDKLVIKASAYLTMAIQNVTPADGTGDAINGGELLADRIDCNPLVGKCFKFSTPLPRLNMVRSGNYDTTTTIGPMGQLLCLDGGADGVTFGGSGVAWDGPLARVPGPEAFDHCTGYSNISLGPGQIKTIDLKFKYDGKLDNYIIGMYRSSNATNETGNWGGDTRYLFGTSMLLAFEQLIRNGSTVPENIKINYEGHWHYSSYVKKMLTTKFHKAYAGAVGTN